MKKLKTKTFALTDEDIRAIEFCCELAPMYKPTASELICDFVRYCTTMIIRKKLSLKTIHDVAAVGPVEVPERNAA